MSSKKAPAEKAKYHLVAGYPSVRVYSPTASKPNYQIIFTDRAGRRRNFSGGTTEESLQKKVDQVTALLDSSAERSEMTVSEMLDAWLDPDRPRSEPWSAKYLKNTTGELKLHAYPIIGQIRCGELQRGDIQRAVNSAPSKAGGQRVKRILGAALRWAYPNRWLAEDPELLLGDVHWQAPKGVVVAERTKVQGTDILWVDPEEEIPTHRAVANLADAMGWLPRAQPWWKLIVLAAAYSGLRFGELLELRASDVDLDRRRISVTRQFPDVGVVGHDKQGRPVYTTAPKGRKWRTTVYPERTPPVLDRGVFPDGGRFAGERRPDLPEGFDLAEMWRQRVSEVRATAPDGLLFPAPMGGRWSMTNFYERRFHPASKLAGWEQVPSSRKRKTSKEPNLVPKWKWHSLRHVFCTYYLWDLGQEPVDVANAAGHSSVDITLRIYGSRAEGSLNALGEAGRSIPRDVAVHLRDDSPVVLNVDLGSNPEELLTVVTWASGLLSGMKSEVVPGAEVIATDSLVAFSATVISVDQKGPTVRVHRDRPVALPAAAR